MVLSLIFNKIPKNIFGKIIYKLKLK